MCLEHVVGIAAGLLAAFAAANGLAQTPAPRTDIPSTFTRSTGEVWSEGDLRPVDKAVLVEATGQRSRVRLLTRSKTEIIVESATFVVMNNGDKGVLIKSVGGATVTATSPTAVGLTKRASQRRMEAHSVEIGIAPDGSGYFRAVRHPI